MAIAHADGNTSITTAVTTATVALTTDVGTGDFLVCVFRTQSATHSAGDVADNVNGNWTIDAISTGIGLAYFIGSAASIGGVTITVKSATSGTIRIAADRFTVGGATLSRTAGNQVTNGSATSGNCGTVSDATGGNLLYGGGADGTATRTMTAGTSNGVSAAIGAQTTNANGVVFSEYVLSTAAGTQTMTVTYSANMTALTAEEVLFSPASGAAFIALPPHIIKQAVNRAGTY